MKIYKLFGLILILGFLLAVTACEPAFDVIVENQTNQTLTVYMKGGRVGDVEPNKEIKIPGVSATYGRYLIEAKNTDGKIIYSREYSLNELVDDLKYRVKISQAELK